MNLQKNTFKNGLQKHKNSFKNENKRNSTESSMFYWQHKKN